MDYLEISVVEHCNLNCKYCSHFSPIAKEIYADLEETEQGILLLKKIIKTDIKEIRLLGGEPLLHQKLADFCKLIRHNFPLSNIAVVTNGILLTFISEDLWNTFMKNDINIRITKYPINLNFTKIREISEKYNVSVSYTNRSKTIKNMNHMPLDLQGQQDAMESYKCCYSSRCTNLKGTKIYPCPIVASIEHFNNYYSMNLQVTSKDYFDLEKNNNKTELEQFLSEPIPFCSYCMRKNITYDLPWAISEKDIKEWTP